MCGRTNDRKITDSRSVVFPRLKTNAVSCCSRPGRLSPDACRSGELYRWGREYIHDWERELKAKLSGRYSVLVLVLVTSEGKIHVWERRLACLRASPTTWPSVH